MPHGKRTRGFYDRSADKLFRLSRSRLDLFLKCQQCFYIDRDLGIDRPPGYPFSLNDAVDALVKKEMDHYRELQQPHPEMVKAGLGHLVPFKHADLEKWRNSLSQGIEYEVPGTNFIFTGGIDDLWHDPKTGEIFVVDTKATSTSKEGGVTLDDPWKLQYKQQVEMYQWLFRKNGFKVSNTAYFFYCNALKSEERFDGVLKFEIKILPYEGNCDWVDGTLKDAYDCLQADKIPARTDGCTYCDYASRVARVKKTVGVTAESAAASQAIHSQPLLEDTLQEVTSASGKAYLPSQGKQPRKAASAKRKLDDDGTEKKKMRANGPKSTMG